MIIFGPGVVLTQGDDINGNNPCIGWRNLVSLATLTTTTEDTDWPARNLIDPSTFDRWQGTSMVADEYLATVVDGGGEVDYLAVARHNFASAGITVSVEAKTTSGGAWSEVVSPAMLADDGPAMFRFALANYYAVRLRLQPGSEVPRCAVMYVGRLLIMQRRVYVGHTPIDMGRRTRVYNGRSEAGHFLGRVILQESVETSIAFQNLTASWYRTNMEPFLASAMQRPFFVAWRPQSYPREVGYAWLTGDARPSNQRPNGMMQVSLSMEGVA